MLTVATLVKNEADRWFPAALEVWQRFADRIVVLDNDSDDGTVEIARKAGCEVHVETTPMFGNEWVCRKRLWDLASDGAKWVLHLDADQIPASDPKPHLQGDVALFKVFDMWGQNVFRSDRWWSGHKSHWWPAVYVPAFAGTEWDWPERGWHSGHVPCNLSSNRVWGMPDACSILHYAYATPEGRERQAEKYRRLAESGHLLTHEAAHAETILDPNPGLGSFWFDPEWTL